MIRPHELDPIRRLAEAEGFVAFGVTAAVTSPGHSDLVRWIDSGYAGSMRYFADRVDAYRHPDSILAGARSIIALAYPYPRRDARQPNPGQGRVARYVWDGDDYHDVLHPKLKRVAGELGKQFPACRARGVVDTAPLMEREVAQAAGIGWRGKNTLLLNKSLGSYFFLACVLVDIDLPVDIPHEASHCGTCTACLDACPTDAFPQAGVLDASRCISYLTIEHRESIDTLLREGIGDWVFGCDVCQEVCPWNRKPTRTDGDASTRWENLSLIELFELDDDAFRVRFRRTPLWRSRRRGLLRNAAIVLGNQRHAAALPILRSAAMDDDPVIAEAARWAIGQMGRIETTGRD